MRFRPPCVAFPLVAALLSAGCGDRGAVEPDVIRFDSAGVHVVENRAPGWAPGEAWLIDPEPELTIGSVEGPDETSFSGIAGALVDGRDRIIVLDAGARALRFFDADGTFLHATGGAGDGPGEFGHLVQMGSGPFYSPVALLPWRGDSILVHSLIARTLYVLDSEGREGRRLVDPALNRWVRGVHGEDRFILITSSGDEEGPPEHGWRSSRVHLFDLDDGSRELGLFPMRPQEGVPFQQAFGIQVAAPGGFLSAVTTRPEIRFHDWEGGLRQIVRLALAPEPIPQDVRQASERPMREFWGFFLGIRVDREGFLWIASPAPDGGQASPEMLIVSPDGRYMGRVQMPGDLRLLDVGPDWVLGVWRDDLDVEYLRLHRLERKGEASRPARPSSSEGG
jgi:hypothetical protein